jgi:flagellar hook-associated protein 1 FlgK
VTASPLISIGMRAMTANYAALQATGNNIANVNTPGYSRQTVELETATGQFSGAGFFGKGVNVKTVSRQHDEFLVRETATSRAIASFDAARAEQLRQLEKVFPTGESGIGYSAGQLFNAFVDISNQPQDTAARQVVLSRAQELAARFRTAAGQLDNLQTGINQDISLRVKSANELARQIADLNQQIANAKGLGHEPNDLLDKRDLAIQDLSKILQVSTIAADDGSTSVFFAGGQPLVVGNEAATLTTVADSYDRSKLQIGLVDKGMTTIVPSSLLGGGSIAGLLQFQNHDLTSARNQLGQMALGITGGLNEQQSRGWDLSRNFGSDILSVGSPRALSSSLNTGTGVVGLSIDNTALVQASDYELEYLGSNNYRLTRLSNQTAPLPVTVTAAQLAAGYRMVDGLNITLASGSPAVGDKFLLQPVNAAARDMNRVLDDPRGIAAASPVTATLGNTNTGTATVAELKVVSGSVNPKISVAISFTNSTGAYSFTQTDNTTPPPVVTTGTGTWTAGQAITFNGWSLQLNGVPASGDTLTVGETLYPANNNGNANALLGLRDQNLIGSVRAGNGVSAPAASDAITGGVNVTDAYAGVLADVGVRVQSGLSAADQSASIEADAAARQSSRSGVNLDEEAARLIQFQQSYQAAAKMLQIAQSLFDSLLQLGPR